MSRILIVDDHAVVRRSLHELLVDRLAGVEVREAAGAEDALGLVSAEPWDLVLLDLSLGGPSGLQTLRLLKQLRPGLRVLVMSMHPEEQYGPPARAAGADGYLMKGTAVAKIMDAVRSQIRGD